MFRINGQPPCPSLLSAPGPWRTTRRSIQQVPHRYLQLMMRRPTTVSTRQGKAISLYVPLLFATRTMYDDEGVHAPAGTDAARLSESACSYSSKMILRSGWYTSFSLSPAARIRRIVRRMFFAVKSSFRIAGDDTLNSGTCSVSDVCSSATSSTAPVAVAAFAALFFI